MFDTITAMAEVKKESPTISIDEVVCLQGLTTSIFSVRYIRHKNPGDTVESDRHSPDLGVVWDTVSDNKCGPVVMTGLEDESVL